MTLPQSVVIHAHCYQPPREDPWLEVVETEPSASPDHDWNVRINRECYERLGGVEIRARDKRAAQRDPDARSGLLRIVNLYAWCSFDAGATLCEWLQDVAPRTMQLMIEGDRASVKRLGHGNAIAAPYHHVILPLASRRDKVTEVRWGLADFKRRFGRDAEGMWLPECAVDEETLEVLAQEGVKFTILAPYQLRGATGDGMPVEWRAGNGRSISILPYEGDLAGEVAFGNLLDGAGALAHRLAPYHGDQSSPRCTTLATDGETFGHHHKGGDTALATALLMIANRADARVTNAAALIAERKPETVVQLVSPSAWSCAHGVERWRSDCGCRLDGNAHTSQRWRRPLREAMDALTLSISSIYEREGAIVFADDPWNVRDRYGSVVAKDGAILRGFARNEVRDAANIAHVNRAQQLLELQRATLRTFTSCAWFFDDVARIETRQVLRYAARAIELSGQSRVLQDEILTTLSLAMSNVPEQGSAADLYLREALPAISAPMRVAAAAAALRNHGVTVNQIASFDVEFEPGRDWNASVVCVTHRRTSEQSKFSVMLAGDGADLRMTTASLIAPFSSPVVLEISDLPEAEARMLLAKFSGL